MIVETAESLIGNEGGACRAFIKGTMKTLRLILSDSLAVLFRLSACNTTSAHIPEAVEESFHPQSSHLLDQQPPANDNESLTTTSTMSSPPDVLRPSSYLQSMFNLTLVEYSRQTGIDLITYPFIASLYDISSVDKAIAVLRNQSQPPNGPEMDDPMSLLMCRLESIVNIVSLLTPSEALYDIIEPVCQSNLDLYSHILYVQSRLLQRFSPAKAILGSIGVLLAVCSILIPSGSI
jgi:hypothetical protein